MRPCDPVPAGARPPAVLAARMDRLPPAAKRLLQVVAVIGMDVSFPLLQAMAEQPEERLQQSLAYLQAAEFLYETRLFPEPEYTFKRALTHEVAYNSLLLEGGGTSRLQTGRGEQARAALSAAIALYRAMDMTFWLPQAEAALAQVA